MKPFAVYATKSSYGLLDPKCGLTSHSTLPSLDLNRGLSPKVEDSKIRRLKTIENDDRLAQSARPEINADH